MRASRAGLKRGVAFEGVAAHQPGDPGLGDAVIAGDLRLGTSFDEYGGDDQASLRHPLKLADEAMPMS
ncbi:hypothetical protein CQY20_33235 [Mycolicibacterium agri]|uniref:Uncharacterized protein n=1 Tax=Mycolicibacterium agri TaxID=36811 RepID=A0A2A7MN92_MYCAG|nr:hypothetical protein CQY20_33235 [Mycolicibacterium agri]